MVVTAYEEGMDSLLFLTFFEKIVKGFIILKNEC